MTQISVALDGPRRRNVRLYAGDEVTLGVTVYAVDGDIVPLTVTNLAMTTWPDGGFTFPLGVEFTVPREWPGRRHFVITGDIAGVRTTLAYGWMLIEGGDCTTLGGNDYGWRWPYGPAFYPPVY